MTPAGRTLGTLLERAVRRVRTDAAVAVALAVVAAVPSVLLVGWLVGDRWPVRGVGPLALALAGSVAGLGVAAWLAWRWLLPVDATRVAAEAERRRGLPEGALRGVLELRREMPPGVSPALFHRSEAAVARGLSGTTARELSGDLGDQVRRLRLRGLAVAGSLAVLTAVAGFAAPERARAGWAPLLHPLAHLEGPAMPAIAVRPGDRDVPRGESIRVEVSAPLRARVRVHWRTVGDVPRSRTVTLDGGEAGTVLGPVNAAVRYWVAAPDGAVSDTFTLRPVDPLLLRGLAVAIEYPRHVARPADRFEGEMPPLELPEGSLLRVRGSTTRPLVSAALSRADGTRQVPDVDGSAFALDWRVDAGASGRWEWRLEGAAGPAADAPPLELAVTADAPPTVRITSPEPEALMPASRRQGVVADAEDDYGVAAAALVFRRVSGGDPAEAVRTPIPLASADGRVLLRAVLDASGALLVPGDVVEYHVEVTDNSPRAQVGRSATHRLRLPGAAELRDEARAEAAAIRESAERLAARSRELERETRGLSRRAVGQGRAGSRGAPSGRSAASERASSSERLGFEAAREAESVLARHQAQLEESASLRQRLEALERALEEAGLQDPELERRLEELRELYRQLATPELKRELAALRESIDQLDPEALEQALEQLAERQQELRESIEESLEMMRRAAAEQELNTLAREAEEIAARQRALAEAMRQDAGEEASQDPTGTNRETGADGDPQPGGDPQPDGDSQPATPDSAAADPDRPGGARGEAADSAGAGDEGARTPPRLPSLPGLPQPRLEVGDRAEQQDSLGTRTEKLNQSLSALQQQLMQMGEGESASQTGSAQQKGESAQESMKEAASQSRQQQGSKAASSGERAAGQMADAAATLDEARRRMTEAWREQAQQAVQQATQEALSLAQREEALRQAMEQAQQQGGARGAQMQQMRSEQAALQQGLQQLGRNLSENGQPSGMVNQDVGRSLARAMLDMQQTLEGLQENGGMPVRQAEQTVESLNRLAMSLLENGSQIEQSQSGSAMQQALERLAELARQQGSLNGQANAMAPLETGRQALTRQLQQLAEQQRGIGRRVGEVSEMMGGREDVLGRLDLMASEAEALARELEGGRIDPEVRARQERLFHRLLDAGRSLEREEYSDERVGEGAGPVEAGDPAALDPALLDARLRYAPPTAEQLRSLPPAYRRLILEYFDRLNGRGAAPDPGEGGRP